MKHYLFFATLSYSYTILRPLQKEIWRRGDDVAWFLEDSCPDMLLPNEKRMASIEEVLVYNPIAVFAPGNYIYDFFPGVKVGVFHGYPMKKRIEKIDDHFTLRGWFDIYCTQGESSTPYFKQLEAENGYFKIYETGWCKMDAFFDSDMPAEPHREKPTILYAPTFSKGISSAWVMEPVIRQLATEKDWHWIITFHPKLHTDKALIEQFQQLDRDFPNVEFRKMNKGLETFRESDALLCDSSSLIVEYMMLDKPVVTYRNTHPGDFLLDVQELDEIGPALEKALTRPEDLMANIYNYTIQHEGHRDGKNSARVLDAVDDFIANYKGRIKRKPLNLFRRLKLRWQIRYFKW